MYQRGLLDYRLMGGNGCDKQTRRRSECGRDGPEKTYKKYLVVNTPVSCD